MVLSDDESRMYVAGGVQAALDSDSSQHTYLSLTNIQTSTGQIDYVYAADQAALALKHWTYRCAYYVPNSKVIMACGDSN